MKLVNWNVEWATVPWRTDEILNRVKRHSPEVACLTETHTGLLQGGHWICAGPDYGYGIQESRRKVLLWSREPWEHVDDIGDDRMPPGRFVSGVTRTSVGEVAVVGLCIPWGHSRAYSGYSGERRRAWEDHETYLKHLAGVLSRASSKRLVVMGDVNQSIPRSSRRRSENSARRAALLQDAMPSQVTLITSTLEYRGRRTIDHMALSADMVPVSLDVISNIHGDRKLSDHFGVAADVLVRSS